jgi:hypothetical protein
MFKNLKIFTSLLALILCCTCLPVMADELHLFTPEEIQQKAYEKLQEEYSSQEKFGLYSLPKKKSNSSFYHEVPVSYLPKHTFIDKEAFEIAEFTFDTNGHPDDYKTVHVIYSGGSTITWTHTGTAEGGMKIFDLIDAKLSYSIAYSTTISNSAGADVPYKVKKNSTGYVAIYAYGYKSNGAIKYKWDDVTGDSGFIYKDINSSIPYKKYSSNYIKFGELHYEETPDA